MICKLRRGQFGLKMLSSPCLQTCTWRLMRPTVRRSSSRRAAETPPRRRSIGDRNETSAVLVALLHMTEWRSGAELFWWILCVLPPLYNSAAGAGIRVLFRSLKSVEARNFFGLFKKPPNSFLQEPSPRIRLQIKRKGNVSSIVFPRKSKKKKAVYEELLSSQLGDIQRNE